MAVFLLFNSFYKISNKNCKFYVASLFTTLVYYFNGSTIIGYFLGGYYLPFFAGTGTGSGTDTTTSFSVLSFFDSGFKRI